MGLGFVVAKFESAIRELTGVSALPETTIHLSSIIGNALSIVGAIMMLFAFSSFSKNQERIRSRTFEPNASTELVLTLSMFVIALLLIAYLLLKF